MLRSTRILRLGAENYHFLSGRIEIRQVDARKLVIRFALVHLLFYAATAFRRIGHVFLELVVRRRTVGVQYLQECADSFLDPFLIAPLNRFAELDALADFLVAVRVLELIMKGLCQIIGDESVIAG